MNAHAPSAPSPYADCRVTQCYQCGKCTAGCPVAQHMDMVPNRLVRLVQLGQEGPALHSEAIWQCVSCQTCTARCPQSVDCAGILDVLRQRSNQLEMIAPGARKTVEFQRAFLANIRRNGRLNELELVGRFKTAVFLKELNIPFLFKDALLAPKMMRHGKFHFVGERVRDREVVDRIFRNCSALELAGAPEMQEEPHA